MGRIPTKTKLPSQLVLLPLSLTPRVNDSCLDHVIRDETLSEAELEEEPSRVRRELVTTLIESQRACPTRTRDFKDSPSTRWPSKGDRTQSLVPRHEQRHCRHESYAQASNFE